MVATLDGFIIYPFGEVVKVFSKLFLFFILEPHASVVWARTVVLALRSLDAFPLGYFKYTPCGVGCQGFFEIFLAFFSNRRSWCLGPRCCFLFPLPPLTLIIYHIPTEMSTLFLKFFRFFQKFFVWLWLSLTFAPGLVLGETNTLPGHTLGKTNIFYKEKAPSGAVLYCFHKFIKQIYDVPFRITSAVTDNHIQPTRNDKQNQYNADYHRPKLKEFTPVYWDFHFITLPKI